jgi:hypothetical protein
MVWLGSGKVSKEKNWPETENENCRKIGHTTTTYQSA